MRDLKWHNMRAQHESIVKIYIFIMAGECLQLESTQIGTFGSLKFTKAGFKSLKNNKLTNFKEQLKRSPSIYI